MQYSVATGTEVITIEGDQAMFEQSNLLITKTSGELIAAFAPGRWVYFTTSPSPDKTGLSPDELQAASEVIRVPRS